MHSAADRVHDSVPHQAAASSTTSARSAATVVSSSSRQVDIDTSPRIAAQRRQFERLGLLPVQRVMAAGPTTAVQRIQINHANPDPDIPFPFDTANLQQAVSIVRSLAVAHDDAEIIAIYAALNTHVLGPAGAIPVTANDTQLLNWLRPIAIAAKQIGPVRTQLANAAPNKALTSISDIAKRIALTSGGLAASGAILNMDTLVNWLTTPPQTNIIFGSLTMQSPATNYSIYTPGMSAEVSMVDPETNRTLQGTMEIPGRQSQILGGEQQTNISQNPYEVPQNTQNFHTFALVATSLFGATAMVSGAVWWLTKPSQGTLEGIVKLSDDLRRLWKQIVEIAQTPP
jgi:hypothetical protein